LHHNWRHTIIVLPEITTQRDNVDRMVASALNCYGQQSPVDLSTIMSKAAALKNVELFLLRDNYSFPCQIYDEALNMNYSTPLSWILGL